jgi:hypothetical protein
MDNKERKDHYFYFSLVIFFRLVFLGVKTTQPIFSFILLYEFNLVISAERQSLCSVTYFILFSYYPMILLYLSKDYLSLSLNSVIFLRLTSNILAELFFSVSYLSNCFCLDSSCKIFKLVSSRYDLY